MLGEAIPVGRRPRVKRGEYAVLAMKTPREMYILIYLFKNLCTEQTQTTMSVYRNLMDFGRGSAEKK